MEKDEREELIKKAGELRKEISELRSKLNEFGEQKESWFSKKEEVANRISKLVGEVRGVKTEKDKIDRTISTEKDRRDKYNEEVKSLVAEIKKVNKEKADFMAKHNIKIDPAKLKEKIEKLESSIETEALSFDKEKKVMEQIKKLRKTYAESAKISSLFEKSRQLSQKIEDAKNIANTSHRNLQDLSGGKKEHFTEFFSLAKNVNELRKEQDSYFQKFLSFKKEFNEMNTLLKQRIAELHTLQDKIDDIRKNAEEEKEKENARLIEEKAKTVEEKLRTRKKLTTEDLLILQGSIKN